jgi:hypothetical protein
MLFGQPIRLQMDDLPDELLATIFLFLPITDIFCSCIIVNHHWHNACKENEEQIWTIYGQTILNLNAHEDPPFGCESWVEFVQATNICHHMMFSNKYSGNDTSQVYINLENNNHEAYHCKVDSGTCETVYCSTKPFIHIENTLYYFELVLTHLGYSNWSCVGFTSDPVKIIGYDWMGFRKGQSGFANDGQSFLDNEHLGAGIKYLEKDVISFVVTCIPERFQITIFVNGVKHFTFLQGNISDPLYFGVTLYGNHTRALLQRPYTLAMQVLPLFFNHD